MTDNDQALVNALTEVFPTTNSMICIWHINKNILSKASPIIRRGLENAALNDEEFRHQVDEDWKIMLTLWMRVVNATTQQQMDQAWNNFKTRYNDDIYRDLIQYIEAEWLEPRTIRRFAHVYTSSYCHFGNAATSRNEAAHWSLKRDLQVSTNDLLTAVRSFERTISYQATQIQQQLADEQVSMSLKLRIPLFRDVITKISTFALHKVLAIRDCHLPIGRGKEAIKPCTEMTTRTLGIPCIHIIKQHIDDQRSLQMDQFHQQWDLQQHL